MAFTIPKQPHRQGRPFPRGGGRSYLAGQGLIQDWPMWEGDGAAASFVRPGTKAIPIGNAIWEVGRIGFCMRGTGTDTDYFQIPNSANSTGLRLEFPLSIELVFEQINGPTTLNSAVWQNHSRTLAYAGMKFGITLTTELPFLIIGDNSGSTSNDRRTWTGTTQIQDSTIYHGIFSVGGVGAADAEIYLNGLVESVSQSGTAPSIGYSSAGNGVTFCGGEAPFFEGFDGRIYSLKYFNRRIFAAEAKARYNRLWSDIRTIPYPVAGKPTVGGRLSSRLRRTA